jgi:hypothetical protein
MFKNVVCSFSNSGFPSSIHRKITLALLIHLPRAPWYAVWYASILAFRLSGTLSRTDVVLLLAVIVFFFYLKWYYCIFNILPVVKPLAGVVFEYK